jgi:uncharacterized protein YggU (UPF0235/DUF167 family)
MYIKVKVLAGASKELVTQTKSDTFEIRIKEKAKNNAANKRVLEIIAAHYGVPTNGVRIINGHQSPTKMLSIMDK